MSRLSVLSLFAGIGGIDLGLERAGMEVVAHSEIDPYASQVLAKHWPDVPNLGDVQTADWAAWAGRIDVIAGGFPCQDVSLAGKRAGLKEGTRSGLWLHFARAIRELRPRYVIVENVPGLATAGLDRVLGDLTDSGFDAGWRVVSAADMGAPHLRRRIIVVADASGKCRGEQPFGFSGGGNPSEPSVNGAARPLADANRNGWREGIHGNTVATGAVRGGDSSGRSPRREGGTGSSPQSWWSVEPDVGRVAHGIPRRVDRLRCLGNAVVPQVAEFVGRMVVAHHEAQVAQ